MACEKKKTGLTSINILLPVCNELETDIFLKILKKAIARSSLDDLPIGRAFKSGMAADEFSIYEDIISGNWNEMKEEPQKMLQSKLLGFWSIKNYPSLGKKLYGKLYRAPKRKGVVMENSRVVRYDEIDAFIFPKMKLRIIELNVCHSTVGKLKYFVKSPVGIGKSNEVQIPKTTMKSFDVDTDYLEICWKALRSGECSKNVNFEHEIEEEQINSVNDSELDPLTKRQSVARTTNIIDDSSIDSELDPPTKRPCVAGTTNADDMNDDLSIGSIRVVLLEMKKDMVAEMRTEISNLENNLKTNFETIHQNEKLLEERNGWKEYAARKDGELEVTNKALSEMRTQIDFPLSRHRSDMETQTDTYNEDFIKHLSDAEETIAKLHDELKYYKAHATEREHELKDVEKTNEKLQADLNDVTSMVSQKQNQIETLDNKFAESEKINLQMIDQRDKLQEELNSWKECTDGKNEALNKANKELNEMRLQIDSLFRQKTDFETQADLCKEDFIKNLSHAEETIAKLHDELKYYKAHAAEKEHELKDVEKTNEKLQADIDVLNNDVTSMVSQMQNRFETLDIKFAESEKINLQLIDQRNKLQEELNSWKECTAVKNEALNVANKALNEMRLQIDSMQQKTDMETQTDTCKEVQSVMSILQQKCVSVAQPWASLLLAGVKKHEGRSWTHKYKGRLWISSTRNNPKYSDLKLMRELYNDRKKEFPDDYPTGCLLGYVQLESYLTKSEYENRYRERDCQYDFAWVCSNPCPLRQPVPMKGQLGIYNLDKLTHATAVRIGFKEPEDYYIQAPKKTKNLQNRDTKYFVPTVTNLIVMKEQNLESNAQRDIPPLYKMEFAVIGKLDRTKDEIKTTIEKLGGKLASTIHKKIAAVISTEAEVVKMSRQMSKAKSLGIQVVPLQFLEVVKTDNAIKYIKSQSICDWGLDPSTRISQKETRVKSKGTKTVPKSVTLNLKNGEAVDPESGMLPAVQSTAL